MVKTFISHLFISHLFPKKYFFIFEAAVCSFPTCTRWPMLCGKCHKAKGAAPLPNLMRQQNAVNWRLCLFELPCTQLACANFAVGDIADARCQKFD